MSYEKLLTDRITYWAGKTNDGDGTWTYSEPRVIYGRFEKENVEALDFAGQKITSRAVVYVKEQLEFNGFIYNGASAETNPETLNGAYRIADYSEAHNPNHSIKIYKVLLI